MMKILYICTHNRCRSILSEAITNHLSDGTLEAYSAGSQPAGQVHPLSLKYLAEKGISIDDLKSQSWDDFEGEQPDIVVTVCDNAANEACPVWFGNTIKVHWGLPDPSKLEGSEEELSEAFFSVIDTIEERVKALLALNLPAMTKAQRQTAINNLVKA
jgi:arsenate reductase